MKKALLLLLFLLPFAVSAQDSTSTSGSSGSQAKKYVSFSTEMIFSFANIDNNGNSDGNKLRWAPVFNPQIMLNRDFSQSFGLFTGIAIRNVGFIYESPFDSINHYTYKFRTYNLGIPVGFKLGNKEKVMFFGGYELELPFVYKQKRFKNEDKEDKDVIWFSDRVETLQHSVLAGFQFKHGATIKFKYYLSNFFNKDYKAVENGVEYKPYNFDANVFYFSLSWDVFTNYKDVLP